MQWVSRKESYHTDTHLPYDESIQVMILTVLGLITYRLFVVVGHHPSHLAAIYNFRIVRVLRHGHLMADALELSKLVHDVEVLGAALVLPPCRLVGLAGVRLVEMFRPLEAAAVEWEADVDFGRVRAAFYPVLDAAVYGESFHLGRAPFLIVQWSIRPCETSEM